MGRKKVLEDELNDLEGKLQRAEKLVTGTLDHWLSLLHCAMNVHSQSLQGVSDGAYPSRQCTACGLQETPALVCWCQS
jgi:hypothetical protein